MTATTHARTTDPVTSKMSGAAVEKAPGNATLQMLLLKQFQKKSMTAEGACESAGVDPYQGGWKRVSDLKRNGLIEPRRNGKGGILRWLNRSGRHAEVLKITPLGREVLRSVKHIT